MRRLISLATVALLALASVPAQANREVMNLEKIPVIWPGGKPGSATEVQKAILAGLTAKGWGGTVKKPGLVHGVLVVRNKYRAEVDIKYNSSEYSIKYANSDNLEYNQATNTIHRNYNNWVAGLEKSITKQMRRMLR
jgi:hypothetical protein